MGFPFKIKSYVKAIRRIPEREIQINSGFLALVGPNGSGKTLLLRGLKDNLQRAFNERKEDLKDCPFGRKVLFLSSGRIGELEKYRTNYYGTPSHTINYKDASFGEEGSYITRYMNESIKGSFQTFHVRPDILLKVQERLKKLLGRDLNLYWHCGKLKARFKNIEAGNEYYPASEASGIIHLVSILSALYDDQVGALLLDEPEVSLHHQLQTFLFREIQKVAGYPDEEGKKLVLIATHSTAMIKLQSPKDLSSIVFCDSIQSQPLQISLDNEVLKNKKLKSLIQRIGYEHKLAFFSKQPLLVEGPSDAIICSGLIRKLELFPEASGSYILPVIGKGEMSVIIKLMKLIGKHPIVLADADAVIDDSSLIDRFVNDNKKARSLAAEKGHKSAAGFVKAVKESFSQKVSENWGSIEDKATNHPYWKEKEKKNDQNKKMRAAFSTILSMSDDEISGLENQSDWCDIKKQLIALLDFLEDLGCFILRRGTIESYYEFAKTPSNKVNDAITEVEGFEEKEISFVKKQYNDIVRCLEYASKHETINEKELLLLEAVSVVSRALFFIKRNKIVSDDEFKKFSKELLREKTVLFKLKLEHANGNISGLSIDINSKIIPIEGFPITFNIDEDPIQKIHNILA